MRCVLSDIASVTMGQSPKSEYYNSIGQGIPFLQGNRTFGKRFPTFDTYTTMTTKTAKAGDVIMSVRAPVGDLNITPVDICLGRGVCGIRMKNGNQDFLFYLLKYYMPQLLNKESGTVFGAVNRNDINGLEIEVPEAEEEQRKISRILAMLDEKIEENDVVNENLERQARVLYQSICENSLSAAPLSDFITIKHGFAFKGDFITFEKKDVILVTPGNFKIGGGFQEQKCKYFTSDYPDDYILHSNDLIVTMTDLSKEADTLGYSALVPENAERIYLHNQRIGLVRFLSNALSKDYVYWFLRSYDYHMRIVGSASGSTVKHTSPSRILEQSIPIPDCNDIGKIKFLESIDKVIAQNELESIKLSCIRDNLLPQLISGALDVSNVDL